MKQDQINRVRKFNRAVTAEVGALEDSFLNRGRPLGSARVLNAIGHGHQQVSALRAYLKLDTGLLSRMLRGLEAEGLVETTPSPEDRRSRISRLTEKGQEEFDIYETLSDEKASSILAGHKNADRLLEAMDIVTIALSRDQIVFEETDYASDMATYCLNAYAEEISQRVSSVFTLEDSGEPDLWQMKHPHGTFVIARLEDLPVGCVGIKGEGGGFGEVKRMWITPAARGLGLGRKLMTYAENASRALGISTLRLDTNSVLSEAVGLYQSMGWVEIDPFNDNPYPDKFFEKQL